MIQCNHNYKVSHELRQERIEERVKELMQAGAQCDPLGVTIHKNVPYVYYNLFEALGNQPESMERLIGEQWREVKTYDDMKNMFITLDNLAKDYWKRQAKSIAEDEND